MLGEFITFKQDKYTVKMKAKYVLMNKHIILRKNYCVSYPLNTYCLKNIN